MLHDRHAPVQAELQQRASTQKPVMHSSGSMHSSPGGKSVGEPAESPLTPAKSTLLARSPSVLGR